MTGIAHERARRENSVQLLAEGRRMLHLYTRDAPSDREREQGLYDQPLPFFEQRVRNTHPSFTKVTCTGGIDANTCAANKVQLMAWSLLAVMLQGARGFPVVVDNDDEDSPAPPHPLQIPDIFSEPMCEGLDCLLLL